MTKLHIAVLCLLLLLPLPISAAGSAVVFGVIPQEESAGQGVVVQRVAEHTPAHGAGLQPGDIIESVEGIATPRAEALKEAVRQFAPGDVVRVRYRRGQQLRLVPVELAARPQAVEATVPVARAEISPEIRQQFAQARNRLRIQLARLPHRMNKRQVQADMQELIVLARCVPSGCHTWLQGSEVQMSLSLEYAGGIVELQFCNGELALVVPKPRGSGFTRYPINTAAERAALPASLLRRLQQYQVFPLSQ